MGVLVFLLAGCAFAQEAEYLTRLGVIQKFAREQKVRGLLGVGENSPARAAVVLGLSRRALVTGESWSSEFFPSPSPDDGGEGEPGRKPFHFDFKVTSVDSNRLARVEVRQNRGLDAVAADPRVDHMVLFLDERFVVVRRETHHRDGRPPVVLLTNGRANMPTGFQAYPIDLPNLSLAEGQPVRDVPAELKSRADFDPGKALDFRFSDLYARPLRAIWRDGDAWPIYVSTPAGVSVRSAR